METNYINLTENPFYSSSILTAMYGTHVYMLIYIPMRAIRKSYIVAKTKVGMGELWDKR